MANLISYVDVIELLKSIAQRHYQINTFFLGRDAELQANEGISYPCLQVFPEVATMPVNANGEYKTIEIKLDCKVLDLAQQSDDNLKDVHSDTLRICQDIINEFNQHPYYQRSNAQLVGDIDLDALEHFGNDYTAGWGFTIRLKLINNNSFCGLPMEDIAGYSAMGPVYTGFSESVQYLSCSSVTGCTILQNYVAAQIAAIPSITASNGLTATNNNVKLGGTLTAATVVDGAVDLSFGSGQRKLNNFNVETDTSAVIRASDPYGASASLFALPQFAGIFASPNSNLSTAGVFAYTSPTFGGDGTNNNILLVYDTIAGKGLIGQSDFSPNYSPFSYVQKNYVDAQVLANAVVLRNGINTFTGGTAAAPSINVTGGSFNSISVSGSTALGAFTAGNATINGDVSINGNVQILGTATTINTQTLQTKDNNITLNLSGTHLSAVGGGITVLCGQTTNDVSTFNTDSSGNWVANTALYAPTVSASTYLNLPPTTLTSTQVAYGNGLNAITGSSTLTYTGGVVLNSDFVNGSVMFKSKNTSPSTQAFAGFMAENNQAHQGYLFKVSSNYIPYKVFNSSDTIIYNGQSGNISILNDYSSGNIFMGAGGSSTPHLAIYSGGTITASGQFKVQGTNYDQLLALTYTTGNKTVYLGSSTDGATVHTSVPLYNQATNNGTTWFLSNVGTGLYTRLQASGTIQGSAIDFYAGNGSGTQGKLLLHHNYIANVPKIAVYNEGVSFGADTTPGATVDIQSATTSAASLRIRNGFSTPSSPNNGDMWNDGTYIWHSHGVGVTNGYINSANKFAFLNSGAAQGASMGFLEISPSYTTSTASGCLHVRNWAAFGNGGSTYTRAYSITAAVFGGQNSNDVYTEYWNTGGCAFVQGLASSNFVIGSNAVLGSSLNIHYTTGNIRFCKKNFFGELNTTPTAVVDITGSTTSTSGLRIRSGSTVSSPNDGDVWNDGTALNAQINGNTQNVTATYVKLGMQSTNLVNGTGYVFGNMGVQGQTSFLRAAVGVPKTGTLDEINLWFSVLSGGGGTPSPIAIYKNNVATGKYISGFTNTTGVQFVSGTSLNIAVTKGDYLELNFAMGSFSSNGVAIDGEMIIK